RGQTRVVQERGDGVEVLVAGRHELAHLLRRPEATVLGGAGIGHGARRVLERARVLRMEEDGDAHLAVGRRSADAAPESETTRDVPHQLVPAHARGDYRAGEPRSSASENVCREILTSALDGAR